MGPRAWRFDGFRYLIKQIDQSRVKSAYSVKQCIDTLCSQSWTASDDPHEIGVLLQRAYLVLLLLFVPVAVLWIFVEPVLLFLGQEPILSQMTQTFLRYLVIGMINARVLVAALILYAII